jgi:hypothetical protein
MAALSQKTAACFMNASFVRYRTSQCVRPALVFAGRKWLHVVTAEPQLTARRVRAAEAQFMTPGDIPIEEALEKYRAVGARNGASKRALDLLNNVPEENLHHEDLAPEDDPCPVGGQHDYGVPLLP